MLDNLYMYAHEFFALLQQMDFWGWMTFAFILIIIELITTTTFVLWLAIAAGLIALAKLFITIPTNYDWAFFGIASLVSLVTTYRMFAQRKDGESRINARGREYIGQVITMHEGITQSKGRVQLDGVWWSVAGPECDRDTKVRIVETDGNVLVVELYPCEN